MSFWNTGEVGRYDPLNKVWKVWSLPGAKSGCYAVYVDDQDKVWVSNWDANALQRFDPVTEKFESFASNKRRADVRQLNGRPGEVWGAESGHRPAGGGAGLKRRLCTAADRSCKFWQAASAFAGTRVSLAGETRIDRLIDKATALPTVAQRIAFISRALIGTPYLGYTLVGGPRKAERFVVRDDGFDCVTFCETVLAAARVFRARDFEPALRQSAIARAWSSGASAIIIFSTGANSTSRTACAVRSRCRAASREDAHHHARPRAAPHVAGGGAAREPDRASRSIATGDIIGFLSRRPGLDYFHTGFIVADAKGNSGCATPRAARAACSTIPSRTS